MDLLAEIIALRRGEPIFDPGGYGTRRFNEYIEAITSQVNTTASESSEITTQIAQTQTLLALIVESTKKNERVVNITANYTAKPFEIVVCANTSAINVTLEANPIIDDIINIKRKDAKVTVNGLIDGKTNKVINIKYYSMKLIYDGLEWVEI